MKVFIAGGTGAVGKRLVPLLASAGHDVYATTRSAGKVDDLRRLGAVPVVLDILDREALDAAIAAARPEVIVHQATALSNIGDFRKFAEEFAQTDRLRTEGTDNLLAAATASGVRRIVAQSFTSWPYAKVGGPVKTRGRPARSRSARSRPRDARGDPPPRGARHRNRGPRGRRPPLRRVLRAGNEHHGRRSPRRGHPQAEVPRRRRRHRDLVVRRTSTTSPRRRRRRSRATRPASSTSSTTSRRRCREWLPYLAAAIGAKPPRHVPAWVGRLAVGELGVSMMTETRGASNEKAKRELGWQLRYPSWRLGFKEGLTDDVPHEQAVAV